MKPCEKKKRIRGVKRTPHASVEVKESNFALEREPKEKERKRLRGEGTPRKGPSTTVSADAEQLGEEAKLAVTGPSQQPEKGKRSPSNRKELASSQHELSRSATFGIRVMDPPLTGNRA